jgi:hypothetical protein
MSASKSGIESRLSWHHAGGVPVKNRSGCAQQRSRNLTTPKAHGTVVTKSDTSQNCNTVTWIPFLQLSKIEASFANLFKQHIKPSLEENIRWHTFLKLSKFCGCKMCGEFAWRTICMWKE